MAKKPSKPAQKGKNKAEPVSQQKNDPPPPAPDTSNIHAVEPPPPPPPPQPQPQAIPALQQPPPAADADPIPIPPPRVPSASASIKFDTPNPPQINSAWQNSPPKITVQDVVDDGTHSNQGWSKSGENGPFMSLDSLSSYLLIDISFHCQPYVT